MPEPILQTKQLVHTYPGGATALKGIDVSIFENEVVSIVGQNGSGKTTLVRHFNGLLRPTAGQVLVCGQDAAPQTISQLSRRVGYVFQNPNHQIFSTTVREELEVAPRNFKIPPEEYRPALEHVVRLMELEPILDKNPLLLDYTTKKLVTIASVLVFAPQVLILDEPTGGLDETGRRMLSAITDMLHQEGHTVVMISHDMDYVAEHAQRVLVMAQGRLLDDGAPQQVFAHAENLVQAQIEPPQITQLDLLLDPRAHKLSLSVGDFVDKYRSMNGGSEHENS